MDRTLMTTHSQTTYCEEWIKLMHLLRFCLYFLSKSVQEYFWIVILRKYKTKENHVCSNLRWPPYHRLNLSPEPLKQHLRWSIYFHFQSIPLRMKRKTQPTKYGRHQSASNMTTPKASPVIASSDWKAENEAEGKSAFLQEKWVFWGQHSPLEAFCLPAKWHNWYHNCRQLINLQSTLENEVTYDR